VSGVNATVVSFHFFDTSLPVRRGLERESQQAEKYTRSATAVRVIFRVCGNKGIACTVAFVYTQALLAP